MLPPHLPSLPVAGGGENSMGSPQSHYPCCWQHGWCGGPGSGSTMSVATLLCPSVLGSAERFGHPAAPFLLWVQELGRGTCPLTPSNTSPMPPNTLRIPPPQLTCGELLSTAAWLPRACMCEHMCMCCPLPYWLPPVPFNPKQPRTLLVCKEKAAASHSFFL